MKKSIKETVRDAVAPVVNELGYDIWDITYQKVGADYHLEITIDSEKGINIEDCERVHRAIDPILDECDPIDNFYYLDVSSPGIERELRTDAHILSQIGAKAEAKLFAPKDGRKSVIGIIKGLENGVVTLETETGDVALEQSEISKITTIYFED